MKRESSLYRKMDSIFQRITKWLVYAGAAVLIFVMLVVFVDVIIAKILGNSIKYATEIITYCDVPLAFLGMDYTMLIGQMTSVDILFGRFNAAVQRILNMIYDLLGIGFCVFLGKLSADNMLSYYISNTLSNPKGGFPIWPFTLVETVSWFALALAFLFCFLRYILAPSLLQGVTEKQAKIEEVEHMIEGMGGGRMTNAAIIGILAFVVMIVLIFLKVPVFLAMIMTSVGGMLLIVKPTMLLTQFTQDPFSTAASYTYALLPLFAFMGVLLDRTGIAEGTFTATQSWLGNFRGGMLSTVIVANTIFGAYSGNPTAGCVVFSRMAMPSLDKSGYDRSNALACIATSASLSSLIPPSSCILLCCMLTDLSITRGMTYYDPLQDSPLAICNFGDPDYYTEEVLRQRISEIPDGMVFGLTYHDVSEEKWAGPCPFVRQMEVLKELGLEVISLAQLETYIDPEKVYRYTMD